MSFVTRKDLPRYNKNNSINYRTNNLWGYLFIFIHILFETLHLACSVRAMQCRLDVNKTTKIPEGLFH